MTKIMINSGHGGNDSGAVGGGLKEKDLTKEIGLGIVRELEKYNVDVKFFQQSQSGDGLKKITDEANSWGADFLLSVHINSGGGTGFESFIFDKLTNTSETSKLRTIIHNEIVKELPDVVDRGKKKANFHVLRESKMDAMLTENMFIDVKSDQEKLRDKKFIGRVVKGHANGLVKAFNLKKKKTQHKTEKETGKEKYFRVVVGSFRVRRFAESRIKELEKKGIKSFIDVFDYKGVTYYRVIAGSYIERKNAENMLKRLKKFNYDVFLAMFEK